MTGLELASAAARCPLHRRVETVVLGGRYTRVDMALETSGPVRAGRVGGYIELSAGHVPESKWPVPSRRQESEVVPVDSVVSAASGISFDRSYQPQERGLKRAF